MADALTKIYDKYIVDGNLAGKQEGVSLACFQAGFTAAAVSMRNRAIKAAQGKTDVNQIINAIGSLSDIPTE